MNKQSQYERDHQERELLRQKIEQRRLREKYLGLKYDDEEPKVNPDDLGEQLSLI